MRNPSQRMWSGFSKSRQTSVSKFYVNLLMGLWDMTLGSSSNFIARLVLLFAHDVIVSSLPAIPCLVVWVFFLRNSEDHISVLRGSWNMTLPWLSSNFSVRPVLSFADDAIVYCHVCKLFHSLVVSVFFLRNSKDYVFKGPQNFMMLFIFYMNRIICEIMPHNPLAVRQKESDSEFHIKD